MAMWNYNQSESDEDDEDEDDETVTVGGVLYNISAKAKRRRVTVGDQTGVAIKVGETVTAGEYIWERIPELTQDCREEAHFDTTFRCDMFHSEVTEVEVFRAFMPLDRETLLNIIRDNADEDNDKRIWEK